MDFLIDRVHMIPKLTSTVCTEQQIGEHVLFTILCFRCSSAGVGYQLLYIFKGFTVDDRLMDIFEDYPVFFRAVQPFLLFKRFGVGFEVDNITAVLLPGQYAVDRRRSPLIQIFRRPFTRTGKALTL